MLDQQETMVPVSSCKYQKCNCLILTLTAKALIQKDIEFVNYSNIVQAIINKVNAT